MGQGCHGQQPTTIFFDCTESQMEQLWHCRLAAYKVYKLKQEPNGASMQLQVSYLLRGLETRMRAKWGNFGTVDWQPTKFISSNEGQMGQACNCRSATCTYYTGLPTRMRAIGGNFGAVGWRPTGFISSNEDTILQLGLKLRAWWNLVSSN